MRKYTAILCMILAAALLLAGCAGAAQETEAVAAPAMREDNKFSVTSDSAMGGMAEEYAAEAPAEAPMAPMPEPRAEAESGVYSSSGGTGQAPKSSHKIITNYYIEMSTDEFDTHLAMLQSRAESLGGYVQHSEISGTKPVTYRDGGRYAYFSFRIPSERAGEFVEYTKGTGEITHSNVDTEDVTLEYFDRETRLEVLNTQLDRLRSILVETDNLADIIALEQEIARVTLEIEQYTTDLRKYDDLIDYTTVNVNIHENRLAMAPAAEQTMGQRISAGLSENMHSLVIFLEDALVWLITSLPAILLTLAALALAVWLIRLIIRALGGRKEVRERRRAERKAKMARLSAQPAEQKEEEHDKQEN